MYKSFRVKNFRCFKDLQINDLGRVNLIAGKNNTGKTALLEAMYIFTRPLSPTVLFQLQASRGMDVPESDYSSYWKQYFFELQSTESISISASGDEVDSGKILRIDELIDKSDSFDRDFDAYHRRRERSRTITEELDKSDTREAILKFSLDPGNGWQSTDVYFAHDLLNDSVKFSDVKSRFIPVLYRINDELVANWYSQLVVEEKHVTLIMQLARIEPCLDDLAVLSPWGKQMLWAEIDGTLMPLRVLGEGTNRLCHFLMTMTSVKPRCLFIDEIENGIHHSVQGDVWNAIGQVARDLDIQVFATTHSLEMVHAAYEAFTEANALNEFRYHRLDRNPDGDIEAVTYSESSIEAAVATNWEIRG